MDLFLIFSLSFVFLWLVTFFLQYLYFKGKIEKISGENERLIAASKNIQKNLSIDAQQIIHDLTANGNAIIRITPINPTDLFWRSPK